MTLASETELAGGEVGHGVALAGAEGAGAPEFPDDPGAEAEGEEDQERSQGEADRGKPCAEDFVSGMGPGVAAAEGEACAAVHALAAGFGVEPDTSVVRIDELEEADDDEQRTHRVAGERDGEGDQADEAEGGPAGEAEKADDGRTGGLGALEELVGAVAGGEFLGGSERGEGGMDGSFGGEAGRLV